jgi:hypothetical protein
VAVLTPKRASIATDLAANNVEERGLHWKPAMEQRTIVLPFKTSFFSLFMPAAMSL